MRGGMKGGEDLGLETPDLGLEMEKERWDEDVGGFGDGNSKFGIGGGKERWDENG